MLVKDYSLLLNSYLIRHPGEVSDCSRTVVLAALPLW